MKKILFFIHDLGQGGAEKVLVNLVNNMDSSRFDVSVITLFGGGVNEKYLSDKVKYRSVFKHRIPGLSRLFRYIDSKRLYRFCIKKEKYDIVVSYLEGDSAKIISGCNDENVKKVTWIHRQHDNTEKLASNFSSVKEMKQCYNSFDKIVCVSQYVKNNFLSLSECTADTVVLYNSIESDKIVTLSKEPLDIDLNPNEINLIAVGTLKPVKGYIRLFEIVERLSQSLPVHLYVLGMGPQEEELRKMITEKSLNITMLGYKENPYKYVRNCDLLVCSSFSEGFSTAVTEALVVGTPVCTVEVSGMREMLGENNEYGIVTENDTDALYEGIKRMLTEEGLLENYSKKALERGKIFNTEKTVKAVEDMLESL